MIWEAWTLLCDLKRRMDYCNPDNFGMYIYNDFHSYDIVELVDEMASI